MAAPRLYTIPPSTPFLPTLIRALVEGELAPGFPRRGDPLELARATLYLPTRRACRLARNVFLEVLRGEAAILPRIAAIGDVDEDEIAFAEATGGVAADALNLPPALGGQERKLLLTQLILSWSRSPDVHTAKGAPLVANNPATALALAGDLARLLDDMTTRKVGWDKLDELVPTEMDEYWSLTLRFLHDIRDKWPTLLAVHGAIEPAQRRDMLIAAEAERLKRSNDGPVIAAGSTGSMPSTAMLLATIAGLPNGAVVLPGLDQDLDDASWELIAGRTDATGRHTTPPAYSHPQFAMQALLRRIGVKRAAVTALGEPALHGRETLLSEALRPAAATERWQTTFSDSAFEAHRKRALSALSVIEAANSEDEALAIAVGLREAIEQPARTAALITPDRALARRVLAALERWKVAVDDSGGDPLRDVPAGIFARLACEVALGGAEPVPLLALLKHPLCRLGGHEFAHAPAIAVLERAILRGPRPRAGTDGLLHALEAFPRVRKDLHRNDPRKALDDRDLDRAVALATRLASALAPLEKLKADPLPLAGMADRHRTVIENLSYDHKDDIVAFAGPEGAALSQIFGDIAAGISGEKLPVQPAEYPELFRALCGDRIVRRPGAPGARVRIYGPLEARLQQADRVVLGGLAEGVWPPETRSDPWLSRPMRQQLGLDLPERRIGLSAHDFAQACGSHEVILTRSAKREGAPVVASRFLQRLAAIAGKERWQETLGRGAQYLEWARTLDHSARVMPAKRPAPRPPRASRPTRLTVTEIEHWLRDPYTIYARHILALRPLDPVDTPPGARDRGTLIHNAIAEFTQKHIDALPDDALDRLLEIGRTHFAPLADYPEARAFWWPRFLRIARYFVGWDGGRRGNVCALRSEIRGEIEVTSGERAFRLAAIADRIEQLQNGRYAILDYKTGKPPTHKQVQSGLAPQLTLEAAILRAGGYKDIPASVSVEELSYVRLSGGEPPGEHERRTFEKSTPDLEADKALARLREVVTKFESEDEPYRSFSRPMWVGRTYGDYDHLARIKEWSAAGGEVDGEFE